MKSKRLVIKINKPVSKVFEFVTNPINTPKWVESITAEETNETPPRQGTIYRNQNRAGEWSEYEMTKFEQNKMFILSNRRNAYHVEYTLIPIDANTTELEYYEWVDEGNLTEPFTMGTLEKLELVLEKSDS